MGSGISFHDPVGWDGWLRYHHESTFTGAGMVYVRGQVLTADSRILASFTQDAMIRARTRRRREWRPSPGSDGPRVPIGAK